MTLVGVIVLFLGLLVAGVGAGLALFERLEARRTLTLMAAGVVVGGAGLLLTLSSADEGESLNGGTYVPLAIVLAVVGYAAWFASRDGSPRG